MLKRVKSEDGYLNKRNLENEICHDGFLFAQRTKCCPAE
jgi:hypothetical protein